MPISLITGATTPISLPADSRLILRGQGVYRIGPLGSSQRPTVDELIEQAGTTIGPFPDTCVVTVIPTAATVYDVISPGSVDSVDGNIALTPAQAAAVQALLSTATWPALMEARPWRLASFGDSRANFAAAGLTNPGLVGSTGAAFDITKTPSWAAALMRDAEYIGNYGVSGDTIILNGASGWQSTSRTNGMTIADLMTRGVDAVTIQYGVNDINNVAATLTTTSAVNTLVANMVASIKGLIQTIASQGVRFVFETSYPCQSGGWAANAANCQAGLDSFNAQVSAWVAEKFAPTRLGAVADSAAALKQADGFANSDYYVSATNIHLNKRGAKLAGGIVATALRSMLYPKLTSPLCAPVASRLLVPAPNWIPRGIAATNVAAGDLGTGTVNSSGWGVDAETGEMYFEVVWTPNSLSSGVARTRIMIQSSIGAAASFFTLAGTETVMGAARICIDDGSGGAPNAMNFVLRQRLFGTAGFFSDFGGTSTTAQSGFDSPIDVRAFTPRIANTNASAAVTAPAGDNTGYALYVMVEAGAVGIPVRIRIYSPVLMQVS